MPMSDAAARNAKPAAKPRKISDDKGLFLLVTPSGGKWWRFKYRIGGKEKLLSLGVYPDVGLSLARERRDEARKLIAQGIDPSEARRSQEQREADFEAVAREWFAKHKHLWTPRHGQRIMERLERHSFPVLGDVLPQNVTAPMILRCIRPMEEAGNIETAHRIKQGISQVMRYAVATGRADLDPTGALRNALPPKRPKHYASLTDPKAIAGLLNAIEAYTGGFITKCALRLAPLLFVRPGELRHMEWTELALEGEHPEWRIPAGKMKAREAHIVPLSRQAVEVLRDAHLMTGGGRYVFPSERSSQRAMSENTVSAALRRMGFTKEEMTSHGFRSLASTRLHELGWPSDVIERQLAHAERNKVKAAYNHAQHLPERRRMMQAWADYLDGLKAGAKVTPIRAMG